MQFRVGCATDIGRRRAQNQDSFAVHPDLGLFAVADGMGGHQGGEIASSMTVEILPQIVREEIKRPNWDPREVIAVAIERASAAIYERSARDSKLRGMGTTATALLFKEDRVAIGHVGDSRCYLLHPHQIWQLTRDHSLVQEKLRAGLITRDQLKTDRLKNVITRSVGFEARVRVEIYEMNTAPGDTFLLCSDGLYGLVEDLSILDTVQKTLIEKQDTNQTAIDQTVNQLISQANQLGGDDNITTIVVQTQ